MAELASELRELKALHAEGILDDDEFKEQKRAVLTRFGSASVSPPIEAGHPTTTPKPADTQAVNIDESAFKFHCFLTHDWGQDERGRDNHDRVAALNSSLKRRGLRTWFDTDRMQGNILDQMCRGIEDSAVVVVCITRRYVAKVAGDREEDNCKLEFQHAVRLKGIKQMIPVPMEEGVLDPTTWNGPVGMALGGQLYRTKFTDDGALEDVADSLLADITLRSGGNGTSATSVPESQKQVETVVGLAPQPVSPDLRPVALWHMDRAEGGVVMDSVGGSNGLLEGNGTVSEGALHLSGFGRVVLLPSPALLACLRTGKFTIAAWMKAGPQPGARIFSNRGLTNGFELVAPRCSKPVVTVWLPAGHTNVGRTRVDDTTWHHVAASWDSDAGIISVFVDGRCDGTATVRGLGLARSIGKLFRGSSDPPWMASDVAFCIGDRAGSRGHGFEGQLRDVGVWEGVLDEKQVATVAGQRLS